MKVYVVTFDTIDYDDSKETTISGVFSSKEKAKEREKLLIKEGHKYYMIDIEEFIVDE